MKLAEIITIITFMFLVNISIGDGAPQWRPQGRFGKRLSQQIPSSLRFGNDNTDFDTYSVLDEPDTDVDETSDEHSLEVLKRLCVKSSIPGLYRCYRQKRAVLQRMPTDES